MEIIRPGSDEYAGLPPETIDDPTMTLVAMGMLMTFLHPRGTDEVEAHMNTLIARDDIIWIQRMDANWKNIPGASRRKPKSATASV